MHSPQRESKPETLALKSDLAPVDAKPVASAATVSVDRPRSGSGGFWESIDVSLGNTGAPIALPISEDRLALVDGMRERWRTLSPAARQAIRTYGFCVVRSKEHRTRIGDFYLQLVGERIPVVLTFDALFFLVHTVLERSLANLEWNVFAPSLDALVHHLQATLTEEGADANADVLPAYTLLRGMLAVSNALMHPTEPPPPDLKDAVVKEVGRVIGHAAVAKSSILGGNIDYGQFAPRGVAAVQPQVLGYFRAFAYLSQASLWLVGRTETRSNNASIAQARTFARAAMLFARKVDPRVDPEASRLYRIVADAGSLIAGPIAHIGPAELARAAEKSGFHANDSEWIKKTARVDHVRHLAAQLAQSHADTPSFHLLPSQKAADYSLFHELVSPLIGARTRVVKDDPAKERRLPSALDVAAWLGSAEARTALFESGADAYDGYEAALERLYARRPQNTARGRHATIYLSWLDAMATYLAASPGENAIAGNQRARYRERKLQTGLGAWTLLRHDLRTFTRLPPALDPPAPEFESAKGTLFVEPHPEAAAKLTALVRQLSRIIQSLEGFPAERRNSEVLKQVDLLLTGAMDLASAQARREKWNDEQQKIAGTWIARLAWIESVIAGSGGADVRIVADVHADNETGRVLEEATGYIDEMFVVVRDPSTGKLVLSVGPAIPHYEFIQPTALRLSDLGWRTRLEAGSAPPMSAIAKRLLVEINDEAEAK